MTPDPLGPAQMVAVADEMASLLRHELRNKFSSVRSAAFYVRRRLRETEAWQADSRLEELSGIIQEEMRVANELLDQQHRLQHLFAAAPARVDAADSVRVATSCLRVAGGCSVVVEVEAQPGHVTADPNELALAVRCLVENAIEATSGGGTVRVRALPVQARYVIEVVDGGPGIPESQRSALLQPFYTTKPGHAGLGLNIARRIADRYAGALLFRDVARGAALALELGLAAGA